MNNTWQSILAKEVVNYNVGIMTFNMEGSTMVIPSHVKRSFWLEKNNKEIGTVEKRRKETKRKQETEEEEGDKEQNLRGE